MKALEKYGRVVDGCRKAFVVRYWLAAAFACAAMMLPQSSSAADRTVTYEAPYSAGDVLSNTETGTLTLDETAYAVTEANALLFTGFEAARYSTTVFNGGWWDFGGGEFPTNKVHDRVVALQSGAVVTNVATMPLLDYYRNKFNLLDASRFYVTGDAYLCYGGSGSNHSNEFCVAEASSFFVGGTIHLSAVGAGTNSHRKEGSMLKVTGEGSCAKAANIKMGMDSAPGDCRVIVTDHGLLEVEGQINFGSGGRSFDNKLYVSDGGVVTASTVEVGTSWSGNYDNGPSGYEVHILDGGSFRANEGFYIGYFNGPGYTSVGGMKLVVSNGTFSAKTLRPFGTGARNKDCEVRISGARAKFEVETVDGIPLFGTAGGCRFIVENGADIRFPWTTYSYTRSSVSNTILVTGTDSVFRLNGFMSLAGGSGSSGYMGVSNIFCIADGAVVTGGIFAVGGKAGRLSVSNGTLMVSRDTGYETNAAEPVGYYFFPALTSGLRFKYGGESTNCVVELSGTSPRIVCLGNASAQFKASTRLVFNIPETGYDYGDDDYVPLDVANRFTMASNCRIEFCGLKSRALRKAIIAKGGTMPLVRAKRMSISDDLITAAQEELPAGYSLELTGTSGSGQVLSLKYSVSGTSILFL